MNLLTICTRFPTQHDCIAHLEALRWGETPTCPHCGSGHVARKAENDRVGRWNCHDCHASFNVLSKTIMQKTKIPLQKWFLAIGLMVNAKKSLSSYQLARDLEVNQPSAWYMQQRIRKAMAENQATWLSGIVEADETYVGGKPRKGNKRQGGPKSPVGRGTRKTAVIGAVERGDRAHAKVATDLSGGAVRRFLADVVDISHAHLMTDEFGSYRPMGELMPHDVIEHQTQYANGPIHTNSVEGFWSLLKRAWYGSHHHYSKPFMLLFVAEACWKYNHRKDNRAFDSFLAGVFAG